MIDSIEVLGTESTQVGEARRAALGLAARLGLPESDAGRVAIVTTELASNLVKHTGGGSIVVSAAADSPVPAIDILALDRGSGIGNIGRALQDGYSTAGSPGTGLGAVQRQSELVEIHTSDEIGTAILARLTRGRVAATRAHLAALSAPKAGEEQNGDGWFFRTAAGASTIMVVDGLGHGLAAREAADAARAVMAASNGDGSPVDLVQRLHDGLRATRGAAVAVAQIDAGRRQMRYAGIGNIAATLVTGETHRNAVSMHGTAGHNVREVREFRYDIPDGALLVMHSDGLSARWDLRRYGAIEQRDVALVAGLLWRDFRRQSDDATVVVVRV